MTLKLPFSSFFRLLLVHEISVILVILNAVRIVRFTKYQFTVEPFKTWAKKTGYRLQGNRLIQDVTFKPEKHESDFDTISAYFHPFTVIGSMGIFVL